MEEKPQLIYAFPRSRSTAILQASNKLIHVNEPCNKFNLVKNFNLKGIDPFVDKIVVTDEMWETIKNNINNKDVACKFLPWHFNSPYPKAIDWFKEVQNNQTFDVYVVYRNIEEICWSFCVARKFGWYEKSEVKELFYVTVEEQIFLAIERQLEIFLNNFPKYGQVISWENLPQNHFDKSKVKNKEQFSKEKIKYINNIDFCREKINNIMEKYNVILEEKFSTLKWAK